MGYIHGSQTASFWNNQEIFFKILMSVGGVQSKQYIGGQTTEARRTTILQPVEQKPHSQNDRKDEKAEDFVPDERTR